MKADMLFDAIGKVKDAYIVSAQSKIGGVLGRDISAERAARRRGVYRRIGISAAAAFLLLISSFSVAMAASEEFRNAVFRFFHISTPITVPPFEEDEALSDRIEVVGGELVENAVKAEYIRVKGGYGHVASDGVVYVQTSEDGSSEEDVSGAAEKESAERTVLAYAIEDGKLSELEPHRESFEYTWGDTTYRIDFDWYENQGAVHTVAGGYDLDTSAEWNIYATKGSSEFVMLTLGRGAQIEYESYPLLYNIRTHEVADVLEKCEEIRSQRILEAEFSPDLSKILLTCGEAAMWYDENSRTVYCYDIAKNSLQQLSKLCHMNVMEASFIDDDTVACLWYDEEFAYTLRTLTLSDGKYSERFSGLQSLSWSSDDSGILFGSDRYGWLVEEDGSAYVYDFKTGESVLVAGFSDREDFTSVGFNGDGTKLLFFKTELGEEVWVTQIGVLDWQNGSFVRFDREGHESPREYSVSWFDNEKVGIMAQTEENWYLYLFTVE